MTFKYSYHMGGEIGGELLLNGLHWMGEYSDMPVMSIWS